MKEKINVIILSGKGNSRADYVQFKTFDTKNEADSFINEVTNTNAKYWTYAQIIEDGETIETHQYSEL